MKNPSEKLDKYSIEYIYKDSEGFRLTNKLLERVLKSAKNVHKKPKLIIDIPRNIKERILLEIFISVKKKGK